MDSPESTNSVPPAAAASSSPTVVQESPFYTYVSNLSPIKLVNDSRVPSAFRELNFPSPSPVFTSPRINQICKENSLRRSQYLSSDSGKLSLGYPGGTKELPENSSDHGPDASRSMGVLVPCIMDSKREFPAQVQSCCSPSGCVDDFFADPIEDCANSSGPSDLCSDQANELCQPSQDRFRNPGKTPKECVQSQSCSPSGSVSKLLANQVEYGKTTDSIDVFPDYYPSQAVEIHNNSTKEIIMTLDPHEGNIRDGGDKVAEPSTSACQAEESPTVYEPSMHLICDQSKDSVGVADNVYRSDERQVNQHTGLASQHAMMGDPAEVPASDFHGYKHSVDQTANGTIFILPSSGKGDSLNHRGEKSTNPIYCSRNAKTHLAENGQGAEQDSTSQLQLELLHIVQPDISHQDNFRAVCNTSVENVCSYEQGCLPSKLQLEGSQHMRAMRKRLEFVSSRTSKMNLECGGLSWNLGTATDRGMSTSIESPSSPSDLETLNASLAESIETSEDVQVSHSANFSAGALSNLSLCLHQTMEARMDSVDISIWENGSSVTVPRRAGIGLHLNSLQNAAVNCNENMQLVEKDLGNDCLRVQGEMALPKSDDQRMNDSQGCITSMTLTCSVERSEQNQQRNSASLVPNSSVSLPSRVNVNPLESSLQSKFCGHSIAPCNMKRIHAEDPCRFGEQSVMSPKKKSKKASENDGCKRCNCKKSKCLKLYCDCFAAGDYCAEACACQVCLNRPEYEDTVLETRQQIENRNPLAFAPKVIVHFAEGPKASGEDNKHATPASARHKIGCNCKRSQCLKKYCECFQSKVGCSLGCRCEGCKNSYGTKNGGVEIVETEHRKTKNAKCENNPCDRIDAVEVRSEMSNYDKRLHLSPFTPSLEGSHGINASKSQFPARRYLSSPESAASALSPFSSHKSGINNIFQAREGNLVLVPYHKELDVHDEFELGTYSPRLDRFADICNLRPLSNSSPSDPREPSRVLFHGSSRLSVHSLLWHGSPNTPTPWFGESKLALESCSDSGALNNYEDDATDILKYTHMPDKGPKMSSPNKKRVSPPHKCPNEMISGSSPSLRGRKFILRSVPSFPSLTPYSNNIKRHGT